MSQRGTRTCAHTIITRSKLEIGKVGNGWGEGVVGMSEHGHADVCGWCGCQGKVGNGWEEGPVGMSERGCADVCGRCGCKGKVGNGLGEGPVGTSERGCADVCARCGCKENRLDMCGGRTSGLRSAWVQGKGWKWVERRAGGHGCVRTVRVQRKSWKWVGRRTGGHERAWMGGRVQMVWGEGPVGMRERGRCADSLGARKKVEMGREKGRWA